ncbi:MAG: carboxypeptidase-like regulatory domain-containing protein [Planctomycetales bacterium]
MRSRPTALRAWIVVVLLSAANGCDRSATTVAGFVTLDGRPLAGVNVVFEPIEPIAGAAGVTDGAGRYELLRGNKQHGPPAGRYRVFLSTAEHDPGEGVSPQVERVPAKYHSVIQFHVELEPGFNRVDFQLDST